MSLRTEIFTVEKSLPRTRLDTFLREKFPPVSRAALKRLMSEGRLLVNGQSIKPTHHPRAGDQIEIHWPPPKPAAAQPLDLPLDILFEDDSLLVLNKPAGLVVHPAAGHEADTLVNALLHHCAGQLSGIGGVARPGIVHRLDKQTSGCLVVAKNDETHLALARQFAARRVKKIYHAIVGGELERAAGEIHAALARHPVHRKRMTVRKDASSRAAHTAWRVLEKLRLTTLVEAQIHTGRTHQIRVHFQFIGHPLLGDDTYGERQNKKFAELVGYAAPRVMLHARELAFTHPHTESPMSFEAPLPEDFLAALKFLRLKK
jgi:23S rRNA pseudouridine1911/1915/1917 synthase